MKKNTWIYHYFTPVYQKFRWYDLQFLRYTVRQTEIGNYRSFFAFLHSPSLKTQKIGILKKWRKLLEISSFYTYEPKTTIIWGTVPEIQSEPDIIFVIFPVCPPKNPPNQDFKKMKKASGDVTILHICTKNHNHMRYGSWDTEWDRHNFCHSGPFFSCLTP